MCGICGIVSDAPGAEEDPRLSRMLEALTPRGPDEEGVRREGPARLGIRRLRIIDLETGRQPMSTADGRTTVILNGEIYNYREIRRELEGRGRTFRTKSDTESVLLGFEEWGDGVFERLDGMFGVAVWSAPERRLALARDRVGEKPLYWAMEKDRFLFASELRAIVRGLSSPPHPDRTAVARYLFYGYSPSPDSLVQGVRKLLPGEVLTLEKGAVRRRRFWEPPEIDPCAATREPESDLQEAVSDAVRSRLVSDVPLGAFLSGGVDSTLVVDRMAALSRAPATFSIGFSDASYDESAKARSIADRIGARHTARVFSEESLVALLGSLPRIIDEPLADASILPTYLLSGLAREQVTVALSGDGGDELFGGYPTYPAHRWAGLLGPAGRPLGTAIRGLSKALPVSDANLSFDFRLRKFAEGLGRDPARRHSLWMSVCSPEEVALLLPELRGPALAELLGEPVAARTRNRRFAAPVDLAMYLDFTMYLAEGVLMKVDRASMARSLEVRAPLLARGILDLAFAIPGSRKSGWLRTKIPLRNLLRPRFPREIVDQPKKGFGIPVSRWLRGAARERVESALARPSFEPAAVRRLWNEHQSGRRNNRMALWAIFIYEDWLARLSSS